MNQLLFERSTGNLSPGAFARLQTARLLGSFVAAPHFRFDGGEKGVSVNKDEGGPVAGTDPDLWAHQSGVNALAVERFEGRMWVLALLLPLVLGELLR